MTVTIRPSAPAGVAAAPPSKSMAHRALICAGLSRSGGSAVHGVAPSQDVLATLDCLAALGAEFSYENETAAFSRGAEVFAPPAHAVLPCRECGSTLRFFIPLALLSSRELRMTGSETLRNRPLGVYQEICAAQSLRMKKRAEGLRLQGPLSPGEYRIPGDISSQFVSGLLFALPLLDSDSVLRLLPPVESRPYIDMTRAALRAFGVEADWTDGTSISIRGGQTYRPREITVEGDWSNAAFFLALGVPVTGLEPDSLQGDKVCVAYFRALDQGKAELDISDCPDLGPVLFAYAAARHGGRFSGTRRLRLKESDRAAAMREELKKFGVSVEIGENTVTVGCGMRPPSETLDGHNDHRIVMALSVLCTRTGGTIRGAEAVNKSFPDFFRRLRALNVDISSAPAGEWSGNGI